MVKKLLLAVRKRIAQAGGKRIVTLDLDSTGMRVLEIRGSRITKWGSMPLEPGGVEGTEEVPSDFKSLGRKVRALMDSSRIKTKDVIVSLNGLYSISRIIGIPGRPAGVITQQVVLEAFKDTVPLSTDELHLFWQTVAASENEHRVFVVGVPRDSTDAQVRVLKAAGINPGVLELRAMALLRAVPAEKALIFNIAPSSCDIVIVVDGIPEVMRTIAWRQEGIDAGQKAEYLATALELTVSYYNSHYPHALIDSATPIFITGQMCGDPPLMKELQAKLAYPVESLKPPLDYLAGMPVSQYAVNIGLALRGKKPSQKVEQGKRALLSMNLLPEIYRPWRPSGKQMAFTLGIAGLIALSSILYQVSTEVRTRITDLEARYSILDREIQRRQLEIKNRVPIEKAIKEFNMILARCVNFTGDLTAIYSGAQEVGIQVKSVVHDGKNITVDCEAAVGDYVTFRKYLAALEDTGRFSSPIPPPEGYPYTSKGTIKLQPRTAGTATPAPAKK